MISTKYQIHRIFSFLFILHISVLFSYDFTHGALHSESVILIGLCRVFQTIYFHPFSISGFKINCPVNPEMVFHTSLLVKYTRYSQRFMFRVLQVLEIFKIWICHILEFYCPPKVTSTLSMRPTEHNGDGKIYADIIDNFYLIVHDRRRLDVS